MSWREGTRPKTRDWKKYREINIPKESSRTGRFRFRFRPRMTWSRHWITSSSTKKRASCWRTGECEESMFRVSVWKCWTRPDFEIRHNLAFRPLNPLWPVICSTSARCIRKFGSKVGICAMVPGSGHTKQLYLTIEQQHWNWRSFN